MARLSMRQIKTAIEDKLAATFPDITLHRTGVLKNFTRPSFFVMLHDPNSDNRQYNIQRTISADIHFFPTDKYQYMLEVMDTQDQLDQLFGLNLPIQDRVLTLNSEAATVVDGVLHFPFSFDWWEDQPQPAPGDLMETLDFTLE